MPLEEDLPNAYRNYYTHGSPVKIAASGLFKRALATVIRGYQGGTYGYQASLPLVLAGKLLWLFPIRRSEADAGVRFLNHSPRGRLLDVGCGSGDWLVSMRELGWDVEGIDFDENAVAAANQRGLNVRCGDLAQQSLPAGRFDAVTLSHVIEHVPDPIETLAECQRILKPGGKVVLFTPNGSSLSRRVFKQNWRGLEPPRHLHVFTMKSMLRVLNRAGFTKVTIRPFIVTSVIYESLLLLIGSNNLIRARAQAPRRNRPLRILTEIFKLVELSLLSWKPSVADCLIAIGGKE